MPHPVIPRLTVQQPWAEPIITYRLSQRWTPSQLHPSVLSSSMVKNRCQQRFLDWGFWGPFVMQAGEIRSVLIGWIYPAHAYMEYQAPSLQREFSGGGNELLLALRQFLGFKPLHTWKTWTNVKHMKHCKRHYFISTVEALVSNFLNFFYVRKQCVWTFSAYIYAHHKSLFCPKRSEGSIQIPYIPWYPPVSTFLVLTLITRTC